MADLSPLRRRMIEDMIVLNLSPATQRSYRRISAISMAGLLERLAWRCLSVVTGTVISVASSGAL